MAYQMDFFAASSESKVFAAINNGTVKYPAYIFIRNADGKTGHLGFVDQNNVFKYIVGEESKKQVVNVDQLPAEGDVEVLYIMNGIVYVFNGKEYVPAYKDHTAELEALDSRVETLESNIDEITGKIVDIETEANAISEKITALEDELEESINALDRKSEHTYEKVKYEVADVPIGTIVNYRDDEIRIMCPENTVFTKQAVGAGGDANSYYLTFKTYAPSDEAVGYIEHLNDKVDAEILTNLSTDKYGRRYQPTWLALAKYDDATGWSYNGKNSSKEHYVGWDYQIDWYNADGVMIASDSIRINLSNENCHSVVEPYYLAALKADVETIKESTEKVVTELETVTEELTKFEDKIIEIEKATLTFVELE